MKCKFIGIIISIILIHGYISYYIVEKKERILVEELQKVAERLSKDENIIRRLALKTDGEFIQEKAIRIVRNSPALDAVIIGDINKTIYSHMNSNYIGEKYLGTDILDTLESGSGYLTENEQGAIETVEPIYYENNVVGFLLGTKDYDSYEIFGWRGIILTLLSLVVSTTLVGIFFAKKYGLRQEESYFFIGN